MAEEGKTRMIVISLGINLVATATAYRLGGEHAAVLIFTLGLLLIVMGYFWPKKTNPQESQLSAPLSQIIKQEANPQINQTVIVHRDAPLAVQRTAAEQNDLDTVRDALKLLKETGLTALRHIRRHGSLTFGAPGGGIQPVLPPGLNFEQALWVYRHCASVGILTQKNNLGMSEQVFAVSPRMEKALDELLYP